ncbi:MAG: hypothetical protein ACOCXX_03415 [Planctomycetota bacterium]
MSDNPKDPLLIAVALPMELGGFARRLHVLDHPLALHRVRGCPGLQLVLVGVGPAASAERLDDVLCVHEFAGVISVGYCGALVGAGRLGQVVLPDRLVSHHDTDRTDHPPEVDPTLHNRLAAALSGIDNLAADATLFTSDHAVFNRPERRMLHRRYGAHIVDMEAAELARACRSHDVPFAAVKVISDTCESELPAGILGAMGKSGFGLLRYLHRPRTFAHAFKVLLGIARGRIVLGATLQTIARATAPLEANRPVSR